MATDLARSIRGKRVEEGKSLRKSWVTASPIECESLTFGDLKVGDNFIGMIYPGDNSGHGGLLSGSYLFKKIDVVGSRFGRDNAVRLFDGNLSYFGDSMPVILIL